MILTNKGEFSGFNTLRKAYLDAFDGNPPILKYFNPEGWSDKTLHISQLGKCPRMQMYRLLDAPKKKRGEDSLANDELMFFQGNIIHALSVGACDWAGILVSFEESLPNLPLGWSGHYDLVYDDRSEGCHVCRDFKTVRQNAFDWAYEWPKPEESAQMRGYLRFLETVAYGEIEHIDRGGANPPQVHPVFHHNAWVDDKMLELDAYASNMFELPPVLPWEFKLTYRKVNNELVHKWANVWYQNNWQCGWCDYLHGKENKKTGEWWIHPDSPCKPEMAPKLLIAKNLKNGLHWENRGYEDKVHSWLEGQVLEWTEEEVGVE